MNVKEINFDADLMDVIVSKNGNLERLKLQWQLVSGNEDTINAVYQTKIIFNEDADYEVYISGKDMMGFDLNKPFTNKFVLDKTKRY